MGNRGTSGLTKRGEFGHVDKQSRGTRLCESTGTGDLRQAREYLAKRLMELREAQLYGRREPRTFRCAATPYLQEYAHKRSIMDDVMHLKQLDPFIGNLELRQVHMGSLEEFIAQRRKDGVKTKTINIALGVVRRILNLSASEWMDQQGLTWLERAPKIRLFPVTDARSPYPLSDEEQSLQFQRLPDHVARMALFKVNTGLREQEVRQLKWDYEVQVPELSTSVFLIPSEHVKNGDDRLVVLNRVAKSIVEGLRGAHPVYVFAHSRRKGTTPLPVPKMYNTAWKRARERAAGVSFEDRQDVLGHESGRITTHYSRAELANLIATADKACVTESRKSPATTWLRRRIE